MYGGGMYGGGMGGGMYGGGMGGGMYGGGMRGGMMGGGMMGNQQDGQQQQQTDPNAEYQFDFRRDLQQTVGGLNASLGLAFGIAQMANLGSSTLKYAWRFSKFMLGSVFNLRNITVPLKFLASLLFGFRYLTKEERNNERLLREAWGQSDQSFNSSAYSERSTSSSNYQARNHTKAWGLIKRGRILGLSKMLVKSLIFAVAGILATLVFRLIQKRKALQLKKMEDEQKQQEKDLIQAEWDRLEENKQPMLQIKPVTDDDELVQQERNTQGPLLQSQSPMLDRNQFSLPWSEEESKTSRGATGYDGELTSMTFKHVIGNDCFDSSKQDSLREQNELLKLLRESRCQRPDKDHNGQDNDDDN